jgi:negative regulator of flagellin synthesis FlgM
MAIDINNGLGPLAQRGNKAADRAEAEQSSRSKDRGVDKAPQGQDSVKISEDANSMRAMQARLERQESFDEARVAEIRQAISDGNYPIDNQRLAEKFLELESKL